jgi:hypothetical protein
MIGEMNDFTGQCRGRVVKPDEDPQIRLGERPSFAALSGAGTPASALRMAGGCTHLLDGCPLADQ